MKYSIAVCLLVLSGCGSYVHQIEAAQKACEPHGGIYLLWGDTGSEQFDVKCADKTYIKGKAPQK